MRRAVDVARDEPEQVPVVAELPEPLSHAGQHPVALALGDRFGHVLQPALDELGQLVRRRWAVQHGLERLRPDIRVGHPGVGELPDVGGDAVELLEGALPCRRACSSRGHERSVDVEEQDSVRLGDPASIVAAAGGAPCAMR